MRPTFDSEAIARVTGGRVARPGPAGPIEAAYTAVGPGDWFVALAGEGFDDHDNVERVVGQGAGGVIVQRPMPVDVGQVVVGDTWAAISALARAARRRLGVPVVAITGSTGKTSTRDLAALALSPLGLVHRTQNNHNNTVGVALTLLSAPTDAAALVLEIGSYEPGVIAGHAAVVEPTTRAVTSVGPAHLEGLGDLDGVAAEKGALFAAARPGDVAVVSLDDPRVCAMPLPDGVRRVTHGTGGDVEVLAVDLDVEQLAIDVRLRTPQGSVSARVPSPARFMAHNAALALAVAWAHGVDLRDAAAALAAYRPTGSRLREVRGPGDVLLLDDTFNANPDSVAGALDVLAALPGRRIAVLGDMAELGPRCGHHHRAIVDRALRLGIDQLLLVGPELARVAPAGAVVAGDIEQATVILRDLLRPGDRVLVKGSRAIGLERLLTRLW